MKLRLTELHYEGYTGQMGVIFFEDGVSTSDVLVQDATRMAAVMKCEWEDGSPANVGQIYLDSMNDKAPTDAEQAVQNNPDMPKSVDQDDIKALVAASGKTYTEEQLGAIADADGIAGLRVIADPLGIKSNSISALIAAILKVAATPKA